MKFSLASFSNLHLTELRRSRDSRLEVTDFSQDSSYEFLSVCRNLSVTMRQLSLAGNQLGTKLSKKSVIELFDSFPPSIIELDLSKNDFETWKPKQLLALLQAIAKNTYITTLNLFDVTKITNITPSERNQLIQAVEHINTREICPPEPNSQKACYLNYIKALPPSVSFLDLSDQLLEDWKAKDLIELLQAIARDTFVTELHIFDEERLRNRHSEKVVKVLLKSVAYISSNRFSESVPAIENLAPTHQPIDIGTLRRSPTVSDLKSLYANDSYTGSDYPSNDFSSIKSSSGCTIF